MSPYRVIEYIGGPDDGMAFLTDPGETDETSEPMDLDGWHYEVARVENGTLFLNVTPSKV